jgi:hypothetical protein
MHMHAYASIIIIIIIFIIFISFISGDHIRDIVVDLWAVGPNVGKGKWNNPSL